MNKTKATTLLLLCAGLLGSCEKPAIAEEQNGKEENNKSDNGSSNSTDNGGWSNDGGSGMAWQNGDTVNVRKFISSDFDEAVWVKGYIVGCATGSGGYKECFATPFIYNTAILIADSRWETNKTNCAAIQLKSGSKARKTLNLADHPEHHRQPIAVCGMKTTYLKLSGMKEIIAFEMKQEH